MTRSTSDVLAALSDGGLLLVQDKRLPNVVTLLTGETPKSSWWSHPKGRLVFRVLSELSEHPDVLFAKLLSGKVTLIHRLLWPALLAAVSNGEEWQVRGLPPSTRRLLRSILDSPEPLVVDGAAVKELERRLLVYTRETHTESGRHALAAQPWAAWAKTAAVKPLRSAEAGRKRIEDAARAIGASPAALPWPSD
jgi:hypothetical protein